jgi:hypothetical protein
MGLATSRATVAAGPNLNSAILDSTPQGSSAAACARDEYALCAELDWRPVRRLDLYTGVIYSEVSGGVAKGYIVNNNTAFTTGLRVAF